MKVATVKKTHKTHSPKTQPQLSLRIAKKLSVSGKAMASSRSSSTSSSSSRPSLTLDLSNLPSLSRPSPPSNTLIITELHKMLVFQPANLDAVRRQISSIAALNSFSPLPSFRRIVCSFLSVDDAIRVRQQLERSGTSSTTHSIFDECGLRPRIYFGEHTPVESAEEARRRKLLEAPHASKLFFISPPPSPPHGWVMRNEDPPNKEVHAGDLANALARLGTARQTDSSDPVSPESATDNDSNDDSSNNNNNKLSSRSRSSTLIYHPNDHGGSPTLPAVMVEDTSVEADADADSMDLSADGEKKIFAHTSRPPLELMNDLS